MAKRILVVDVAAHEGGALSILQQYHQDSLKDTDNIYFFCVSLPELSSSATVKVLRFPWVKKSWLHRLWFEHVTLRRILRQCAPDEILSLQNILAGHTSLPQTLYLHQPLPFCGYRFSLWQNPKFWIYQNIIGPRVLRSVRNAQKVIVQTHWMKEAVCQKAGISGETVEICAPHTAVSPVGYFHADQWKRSYFFPASAYSYKNHAAVLQAMLLLKQQGITDYTVRFTLTPEQLPLTKEQESLRCQLILEGSMPSQEVMEEYTHSVLLFPSYIETFGLPLLEARETGTPILASDCPFSREILDGYADVSFFDPFRPEELARLMKQQLEATV